MSMRSSSSCAVVSKTWDLQSFCSNTSSAECGKYQITGLFWGFVYHTDKVMGFMYHLTNWIECFMYEHVSTSMGLRRLGSQLSRRKWWKVTCNLLIGGIVSGSSKIVHCSVSCFCYAHLVGNFPTKGVWCDQAGFKGGIIGNSTYSLRWHDMNQVTWVADINVAAFL